MIKNINIRNFQSHLRSTLLFHDGVNVIIGATDSGKSALIRALRWVLKNDQKGESFRSHESKVTEVSISLKEEVEIIRTRSNKDNSYELDSSTFENVSRDVPIEIFKVLNIDDINVQAQMDSPFLLSESSGEVGRILNKVVGMEEIDTAMSGITSIERANNSELSLRGIDLTNTSETLKKYKGLNKLEIKVAAAEYIYHAHKNKSDKIKDINKILESLEKVEGEQGKWKGLANTDLSLVNKKAKLFTKDTELYNTLNVLLSSLISCKRKEVSIRALVKQEDALESALELQANIDKINKQIKQLADVIDKIDEVYEEAADAGYELERAQKEFKELLGDECPLCGQEIGRSK